MSTEVSLTEGQSTGTIELGGVKFAAWGDRVLILEDEFRSGYECAACGGSGKTACPECHGEGSFLRIRGDSRADLPSVRVKCSHCENGAVACSECAGKGGLIVAPEVSQRRPTTGEIASVGPGHYQNGIFIPTTVKVGQRVMYSNFAGYVVDLTRAGRKVSIRILHETEILTLLWGHLELRNFTGKTEIAEVTK